MKRLVVVLALVLVGCARSHSGEDYQNGYNAGRLNGDPNVLGPARACAEIYHHESKRVGLVGDYLDGCEAALTGR